MTHARVVAIDGAAGSGKSTLARGLAAALGLPYVNTGSMYRALTLAALEAGIGLNDEVALAGLMRSLRFSLGGYPIPELWIEGSPPEPELTSARVDAAVSAVARHPQVRALMREEQRRLGAAGAVMEGRDIASVVFPDAALKIYLVADPAVRARRRSAERHEMRAGESLHVRDDSDSVVNPFEPQADAIVMDTTSLDIPSTLEAALSLARERMPKAEPEAAVEPEVEARGRRMTDDGAPTVAVVGRQNVGKSTLINRLLGHREAIAHGMPGVTRDRVVVPTTWRGRRFGLVDTAGFLSGARGIDALSADQADRATAEADVILLVVDSQAGVTEEDAALGRRLRRASVPVLVVANKVDTDREEADTVAFFALGLGEPVSVSGLHGRATGDLLDRIVELLPRQTREAMGSIGKVETPRFAIVGRPNVGKSTLFNALVGQERSVVFEEAGTTRDPVDAVVNWPDGPVRFVDTAGLRREVKTRGIEYFSLVRTTEAIARAQVAVLVIDATEGFTGEDKKIANRVMEAGRAFLLVANKWDLVEEKDRTFKILTETMTPFARATALRTSALRGQGIPRLPPLLMDLHDRWALRVPTWKVNEVIHRAQAERPTPRLAGTMHYATQVGDSPPNFVVFGGKEPDAGYRRFLENRLRKEFGFEGVPIRLRFRSRTRGPKSR